MKRRQEGGEEEKRWGQRREKEEKADEKAVEPERKKKRKEKKRGIGEGEEDGRKARSGRKACTPPPPLPDAFPSQRLGNNMTPIKGELGKNTTPTKRDPEKLIQRRQGNPTEDSRTSSIHLLQASSTYRGKQNLQKHKT